MERVMECCACGRKFRAHGNRAKYCPKCKEEVSKMKKAATDKARRDGAKGVPKPRKSHLCDSPERVALCLNCTQSYCPGECELLKQTKSGG